jgi:hypothetical protein
LCVVKAAAAPEEASATKRLLETLMMMMFYHNKGMIQRRCSLEPIDVKDERVCRRRNRS